MAETDCDAWELTWSAVFWSCAFILSNCEAPSFGSCVPVVPLKESLTAGVTALVIIGSINQVLLLCTLLGDRVSVAEVGKSLATCPSSLLTG